MSGDIYFSDCGPELSEGEIADVEVSLGQKLPSAYKSLLLKSNGGIPSRSVFAYTGYNGEENETTVKRFFSLSKDAENSILSNYAFYVQTGRISPPAIPIAVDLGSNLFCIRGDRIVFWDHEYELSKEGNTIEVAPSLEHFIDSLRGDDGV